MNKETKCHIDNDWKYLNADMFLCSPLVHWYNTAVMLWYKTIMQVFQVVL